MEIFFAGIAQRTSAWFLTRIWWLQRGSVIAASAACRGCPNTCEHLTGWSTNDRLPMQLQTRASKQFGLLLNVCINDMMKIDMSNIYFLMLNDLSVLFNANYVHVWSSVHCHCYMLFALVFCLLSVYVKTSFAVYSKVICWKNVQWIQITVLHHY